MIIALINYFDLSFCVCCYWAEWGKCCIGFRSVHHLEVCMPSPLSILHPPIPSIHSPSTLSNEIYVKEMFAYWLHQCSVYYWPCTQQVPHRPYLHKSYPSLIWRYQWCAHTHTQNETHLSYWLLEFRFQHLAKCLTKFSTNLHDSLLCYISSYII